MEMYHIVGITSPLESSHEETPAAIFGRILISCNSLALPGTGHPLPKHTHRPLSGMKVGVSLSSLACDLLPS